MYMTCADEYHMTVADLVPYVNSAAARCTTSLTCWLERMLWRVLCCASLSCSTCLEAEGCVHGGTGLVQCVRRLWKWCGWRSVHPVLRQVKPDCGGQRLQPAFPCWIPGQATGLSSVLSTAVHVSRHKMTGIFHSCPRLKT